MVDQRGKLICECGEVAEVGLTAIMTSGTYSFYWDCLLWTCPCCSTVYLSVDRRGLNRWEKWEESDERAILEHQINELNKDLPS